MRKSNRSARKPKTQKRNEEVTYFVFVVCFVVAGPGALRAETATLRRTFSGPETATPSKGPQLPALVNCDERRCDDMRRKDTPCSHEGNGVFVCCR